MEKTAKQEAVRMAYGEYWEQLPDTAKHQAIYNNGYIIERFLNNESGSLLDCIEMVYVDVYEYDDDNYVRVYRPKSLQGIENNRGWIRIESEDWLKEHRINSSTTKFYINDPDEDYFDIAIQLNDKEESIVGLSDYLFMKDILIKSNIKATHYQPIVKPEKPIY